MFKVFAHRGFRARYPENTLLAFQKALETGCHGIELDVQLSKDSVPVIMHDETLDRTTSGTEYVKDLTLAQLKDLDAGRGEKIPTLGEYFKLVRDSDIITNIELKNSVIAYDGLEEKVIAMIRDAGVADRVILSSFNFASVRKAKALAPDIPAALIAGAFYEPENLIQVMREHKIDYIHPSSRLYLKSLRDPAARAVIDAFPANVWTVNDEWEARKLMDRGVCGICTDDPGLVMSLLSV